MRLSIKNQKELLSSSQIRMAMAALGWSNAILAEKANIGKATVARYLLDQAQTEPISDKIEKTFTENGIEFIKEGEYSRYGGAGVRYNADQTDYTIGDYYIERVIKICSRQELPEEFPKIFSKIIFDDIQFEEEEIQENLLSYISDNLEVELDNLDPDDMSEKTYYSVKILAVLLDKKSSELGHNNIIINFD